MALESKKARTSFAPFFAMPAGSAFRCEMLPNR
jgi:hypothetical protein